MWTQCAASVSSASSSPTVQPHARPSNQRLASTLLPRPFQAQLRMQRHKVMMCPTTPRIDPLAMRVPFWRRSGELTLRVLVARCDGHCSLSLIVFVLVLALFSCSCLSVSTCQSDGHARCSRGVLSWCAVGVSWCVLVVAGMPTAAGAPGSTGYVNTGSEARGAWPSHAPPAAQHRPQAQQHGPNAAAHSMQAATHMAHPGQVHAPVHNTPLQPMQSQSVSQQHPGMPGQSAPAMSMSAQSCAHIPGTKHTDEQQHQQGQMKPSAVHAAPLQAQQQQSAHHQSQQPAHHQSSRPGSGP